jgi:hypothetical protein
MQDKPRYLAFAERQGGNRMAVMRVFEGPVLQQRLELPAVAIRLLTRVGTGRSLLKGFVNG